ncbi:MAG: hypothetical protein CVU69_05215 [Deltaproteobacteria bacterium HGW-Deltaproteobacteria-4]|nr:MAG: hypothetical protein CVU69_05215 [Deltaproteobacteria bacterium HGW-Deltaproteobacteria-4]
MRFKMIVAGVAALCLCAVSAGAASLDLSLNDDSVQAQFFLPVTQDAYGTTQVGVRGLYNDDHDTKLVSGEIDFIGKPGDIPGLTAGVGMIVWGGEAGRVVDVDIFSVGIGAKVGFAPPQLMGIGIDGKFFYGPKILSGGDSERVFESGLRLSYAIIPKARLFVEYQKIHVDLDGGGDGDIDDDLRIGFEAKF